MNAAYPGIFYTDKKTRHTVVVIPDLGIIEDGKTIAKAYKRARMKVALAYSHAEPSSIEKIISGTKKGDLVVMIEPLPKEEIESILKMGKGESK